MKVYKGSADDFQFCGEIEDDLLRESVHEKGQEHTYPDFHLRAGKHYGTFDAYDDITGELIQENVVNAHDEDGHFLPHIENVYINASN